MPSLCSVLPVPQGSSWAKRAETTTQHSAASLGRRTKPLFRCHYPFLRHSPVTTIAFPRKSVVQSRQLRPIHASIKSKQQSLRSAGIGNETQLAARPWLSWLAGRQCSGILYQQLSIP